VREQQTRHGGVAAAHGSGQHAVMTGVLEVGEGAVARERVTHE
jgi:hypothetical protein